MCGNILQNLFTEPEIYWLYTSIMRIRVISHVVRQGACFESVYADGVDSSCSGCMMTRAGPVASWWGHKVGGDRERGTDREIESAHTHTHTHTHRCNAVLHTVYKGDNKHRSTRCTLMFPAARPPPQDSNHRCGLVSGSDAAGQHPLCGHWVRRAAGRQGGVLLWYQGCLLLDGVRLCAGSDGHGRRLEKSVGSERGGGAKEPDHRLQVSLWSDCVVFRVSAEMLSGWMLHLLCLNASVRWQQTTPGVLILTIQSRCM